jgi:hypothetical protein
MQFGGWSQFGGGTQFGGASSRAQAFYRVLRSIQPPGVYSTSDDTLSNKELRTFARALGDDGQVAVDRLEREIFPHTAAECLTEWEALLGIVPLADATLVDRQAACLSVWRGAQPSTPKALRNMLASVLAPTHAFWDRFDDGTVSWRFIQRPGAGSIGEGAGILQLTVDEGVNSRWDAFNANGVLCTLELVDRDDSVTVMAKVQTDSLTDGAHGGVTILESLTAAVRLRIHEGWTPGERRLVADEIEDGVVTTIADAAAPDEPCWLVLERAGKAYTFKYGASLDALTTLHVHSATTLRPAEAGVFVGNNRPGYHAGSMSFAELRLRYGKQANNVELVEMRAAHLPGDAPEDIFFAYVHRDVEDPGAYDIRTAQRLMDRCKQGHTLILVGESDSFCCDDPYSLLDRDVLSV